MCGRDIVLIKYDPEADAIGRDEGRSRERVEQRL
jgi:hypothetical protein